jgi:diguanylate cyclase (GGDEF)-like protein
MENKLLKNDIVLPGAFFAASLLIISLTVAYSVSDLRDRDSLIIDLTEQRRSLFGLEASLANMNNWIVQLIYLNNQNNENMILTEAEDLQIGLIEFRDIAERHDFLLDQSLVEEVEPLFDELRGHAIELVSASLRGENALASTLYEGNYLPLSREITQFSSEALYGKISELVRLLRVNEIRLRYFSVLFLLEIMFTFTVTFLIHRRVSQRLIASEEKLHEQAKFDPLTGLANRRMLEEHVEHALARSKRSKSSFALFYLDLDDFKKVNDNLGHAAGDRLLKEIADRISGQLRESDIFSRLGGDEFVVLVERASTSDDPAVVAKRILRIFEPEFKLGEHLVKVSSSIGVSIYPADGESATKLLQNADTAMYKAKEAGRNAFMFYSLDMTRAANAQLIMENEIRKALQTDAFRLYYQPRVNAALGVICGAEALIRWQHPEKGLIAPAEFISVAEKSDLIIDIGNWVRQEAVQQLASWAGGDFASMKISVNVSGKEFLKNKVIPHLQTLFAQTGLEQNLLELEITESTLMAGVAAGVEEVDLLQGMGMGLSVDDFGTGYSSLSYLKNHAIDTLKIDRSFIDSVIYDERNASIVRAIIAMAHGLNISVVAEGVENAAQRDFLQAHQCDQMQGFFYCTPLPVAEFESFVRSFSPANFTPRADKI